MDVHCLPYRGLGVLVRINKHKCASVNGSEPRYGVSWFLHKEGPFVSANVIASSTEPVNFVSAEEAARFAEQRAHSFADCTFVARERV
jgi:hypothetical protein